MKNYIIILLLLFVVSSNNLDANEYSDSFLFGEINDIHTSEGFNIKFLYSQLDTFDGIFSLTLLNHTKNNLCFLNIAAWNENRNNSDINIGLYNYSFNNYNYLQIGLVNNIEHTSGVLNIGIINITGRSYFLDIGILNLINTINPPRIPLVYPRTPQYNQGVQIGLYNKAGNKNKGLQLGFINSTTKHSGLQIGLFNYISEGNGIQIGVINVNSNRWMPIFNW